MKNSKKIIILTIFAAIFVMAVGYAAFATELTVNGGAEIVGQWKVEITGIEATTVNGTAVAGTPSYDATSVTFDADLKKPGDSVVYTITVKNTGSIDAALDDVSFVEQVDGSPAIVYEHTSPASSLASGATTTFTVTVTYDENIEEVPTVLSKTITGTILYVQAD